MNATELAKEKALWLRTGAQDCGNTIDIAEIREELGSDVTAAALKLWLLKDLKPADMSGALEFPEGSSDAQQQALLDAWATGWSTCAARLVRERVEEDAEERVFYEGPNGLMTEGYYVKAKGQSLGFRTRREALNRALEIELDDSDR